MPIFPFTSERDADLMREHQSFLCAPDHSSQLKGMPIFPFTSEHVASLTREHQSFSCAPDHSSQLNDAQAPELLDSVTSTFLLSHIFNYMVARQRFSASSH